MAESDTRRDSEARARAILERSPSIDLHSHLGYWAPLRLPDARDREAHDQRFILHLAGRRFTLQESEWGDSPRRTRFVAIGRGLDEEPIRTGLEACAAGAAPRGATACQ